MTSYFSALVDFVHAHSQYTHIAIFLLALSEAIPVVGTVVPGSTLIIGISALATSANGNPWLLVKRVAPVCDICHVRIAALAIHSCSGSGAAALVKLR
jgi:hypothetical protein